MYKRQEYIKPVVVAGSSFENLIKWLTDSVDGTKNAVTVTVGGAAPTDAPYFEYKGKNTDHWAAKEKQMKFNIF